MQNFKVFGANDKLCGRMDRSDTHIVSPRTPCETSRNSRETAAKLAKHPVRNPRNTCETPAKHSRNTRETHRLQPSST